MGKKIHADVKPKNVVINAMGDSKLLGGKAKCSGDFWSLGITLYYLLFGGFPNDEHVDDIHAVDAENVLDYFDSKEQHSFLMGLLTKDPNSRLGHGGSQETLK